VFELGICPVSPGQAAALVAEWARTGQHRTVCAAGVDLALEAHADPDLAAAVNGADLVVADGLPLAWALGLQGRRAPERIDALGLMLAVCARAEALRLPVGPGCPDPEAWMTRHRDRIPAVLVGVGAAFESQALLARQRVRARRRNQGVLASFKLL
jgi:N-acetylglucosaminyldiphosphoundecaprenol N-acetyl-beta-D-mannosaminyltransferase